MPWYIIRLEKFDEQLDREIGIEEVVMCKNCKYAHMTNGGEYYCNVCVMYLDGDFYCAFGERKEDAENT